MAKIQIDIEPDDGAEHCTGCVFLSEIDERCMLFDSDLCGDATMAYFRCECCMEREIIDG